MNGQAWDHRGKIIVNPNSFKSWQWQGGLGRLVLVCLFLLLLGTILPDWLINTFVVGIGLLILSPFIAIFGLQWWIRRNLIQGPCPACQAPLALLKQAQMRCPNCGTSLTITNGQFERVTPPGTVDVEVQVLEQDSLPGS
jgi:ABC-type uncharacterized transport system permease subunit